MLNWNYSNFFDTQLLEEYNIDEKVTSLMNTWDIHIVPTVNPDGYVFSHEQVSQFKVSFKGSSPSYWKFHKPVNVHGPPPPPTPEKFNLLNSLST